MTTPDVRLTLPGDIPGLLRRGSCVRISDEHPTTMLRGVCGVLFRAPHVHSMMGNKEGPCAFVAVSGFSTEEVALGLLALDLTDATGRQHALWWLARTLADRHDLRPEWWQASWTDRHTSDTARWWAVWIGGMNYTFGDPEDFMQQCRGDEDVPALHNLWKERERLLVDGSRWVDAEALRRVCLHVAGREVGCG